jgi:hypothetical protein
MSPLVDEGLTVGKPVRDREAPVPETACERFTDWRAGRQAGDEK